jgi:hypothetical protein
MANLYVYSGAAGTGTGADWTNAFTTIAAAGTASAAGDDIWVAHDHAENTGSAVSPVFAGTAAAPNRIICVNRAGSVPPVAADLATTATVTVSGASASLTMAGFFYCYGISFIPGSGQTTTCSLLLGTTGANYTQTYDSCVFKLASTGTGSVIQPSQSTQSGVITWINCAVQFAATGQVISPRACTLFWRNAASAVTGATIPTNLFFNTTATGECMITLDGVDLSALGSGKMIFNVSTSGGNGAHYGRITNCKLGASVTIAPTPTGSGEATIDVINCDSGATNYRSERYRYQATLTTETTIVQTSPAGASDGTTPISWKVATTANNKRVRPFECFEIVQWVDTMGWSKTATVQVITDNVVLTSADLWVEAQYLGSGSFPQGSFVSSAPATILTAGSSLTTSTSTWTTTGMTTPKPQQASVSFTPGMKGYVRFVVRVAKASATVYVDPLIVIA